MAKFKIEYRGRRTISIQDREHKELELLAEHFGNKPIDVLRRLVHKEAMAHGFEVVVIDKPKRGPRSNKEQE